ncbi:hypothetical protein [Nonomuraea sp. NPDC049646]|uniref:hypothetical protein n=1 Tax=unclassified Nonomuraea TaxID=2593643 RepID=UPI0037A586E9
MATGIRAALRLFAGINKVNADRRFVSEYLRNGSHLAVSGTEVQDIISAEHVLIGSLLTQTDGCWMWPSDMSYYVANYGVDLPAEFVSRVHNLKGVPPKLTGEQLIEVEHAVFGG